jgi:hypothetical protein
MFETFDLIARIVGYLALLVLFGWLVKNWRSEETIPPKRHADDEISPKDVVRPLVDLQRRLEDESRAISAIYCRFDNGRYDVTFEKRANHIDCFVEDGSTRTFGTGTGKFAHIKMQVDDLTIVGRWAATTAEEHRASVESFRAISDAKARSQQDS